MTTNTRQYAYVKQSLEAVADKLSSQPKMQSINIGSGKTMRLQTLKLNTTVAVCKNGSVFELNTAKPGKCRK